jgi:hypothetical protein
VSKGVGGELKVRESFEEDRKVRDMLYSEPKRRGQVLHWTEQVGSMLYSGPKKWGNKLRN